MCILRWQQAEAEQLRRVLAEVQAANEQLSAQREERRRAAQDLLAKSQVGCLGSGGRSWLCSAAGCGTQQGRGMSCDPAVHG